VSGGVLGSNGRQKKRLMVWNWHGDTNSYGEMEPRVIYHGPEKDYRPGNPAQSGRRRS